MTETEIRRIVRSELHRLLVAAASAPEEPAPGAAAPDVEEWVRGLPPNTEGSARALLARYTGDGGNEGEWVPRSFAVALSRLCGRYLVRRRDRTGLFIYKRTVHHHSP